MSDLKSCPNCKSNQLKDCYIYIRCMDCLMCGPKMNGGVHDEHADYFDHAMAIAKWNDLPRRKSRIADINNE